MAETSPQIVSEASPHVALDVLELWVADLGQTKRRLLNLFSFEPVERMRAPRDHENIAGLRSGNVRLLLCEGRSSSSAVARHVATHGDDIADVALVCDDAALVVERARARGLQMSTDAGCACIDVLGDGTVRHSVRDREIGSQPTATGDDVLQMRAVDHVTYCLPWGTMDRVARVYREVFGLQDVQVAQAGEVGDAKTGMRSCVLRSAHQFTVVLTEPLVAMSGGQTQHFLQAHGGAGVQHVALAYDDLAAAVRALRQRGVPFLPIPPEHLEGSHRRLQDRPLPWDALRREEILVDADDSGFLFQLFTRPIAERGTFFFELIHRDGATGFGAANVRALFAAVEASVSAAPIGGCA